MERKQTAIWLPARLKEQLQREADKRGISVSICFQPQKSFGSTYLNMLFQGKAEFFGSRGEGDCRECRQGGE